MLGVKRLNKCDVFVGLWGLYYLQGIIYPQGVINQLLQMLMIIMGLEAFAKCMTSSTCGLIRASSALIIMYAVYGGIIIMFGDGISWTTDSTYLKSSLNSLLPILFFYIQAGKGSLNISRLRVYSLIMMIVIIVYYTHYGHLRALTLDEEEITNNISYMFVSLLPMVFLFHNKPVLQYGLLTILMLYIIIGMKRGAILIGVIAVIIIIFSSFTDRSNVRKFFTMFLSVFIIVGLFYVIQYMMENSPYFIKRIDETLEGRSSGRDIIYSKIWDAIWNERNVLCFLFGHGANSSIRYAGNFAHQDWLETLCNNGFVGTCILTAFFLVFAKTVMLGKRNLTPQLFYCFLTLWIITFLKTMFSMSIQNLDMSQGLLIGYLSYASTHEAFIDANMVRQL